MPFLSSQGAPCPRTQPTRQVTTRRSARRARKLAAPVRLRRRPSARRLHRLREASGTSLADAQPLSEAGPNVAGFHETGRASWYGRFFHGRRTANGERYDMHALTAAHRTLPLGSYVKVTNPANDSSVDRPDQRPRPVRARPGDRSLAGSRYRAAYGTRRHRTRADRRSDATAGEGGTGRDAGVER